MARRDAPDSTKAIRSKQGESCKEKSRFDSSMFSESRFSLWSSVFELRLVSMDRVPASYAEAWSGDFGVAIGFHEISSSPT